MTMRRFVTACVDCGGPKQAGRHPLTQRCNPCADVFMHYMTLANRAIAKARRNGVLSAAADHPCVDCGKPARDWDHRDYTKPLDVQAVCRGCNQHRGAASFPKRKPAAEAA